MSGTSWGGSYALLPQVPTSWSIAGAGDFNADGNPDIIWQNTITGDRSIWFMSGNTWAGTYALLPQVSTQWSIAGVGDFNGDGKPDLVWQNTTTGDRSIWFMNGSTWDGTYALLPRVAVSWQIAAVGDFNADGKPDLVWQNTTTGERSIWFMNGATWSGTYALLPTVPTQWRITGAADFDGDGKPDLVWQNIATGERSIWLMNGSSWNGSYALLPTVPIGWSIAGVMAPLTAPAVISSISPAVMIPGTDITIVGAGFAPTIGGNSVTIDGIVATVSAASPTQLTVRVPTTLPCNPTHAASVSLVTSASSASAMQPLRVGVLRSLAIGGSIVVSAGNEVGCNDLPAVDGRYVLSVFNTTESPDVASATGFRLSGAVTARAVTGAFVSAPAMIPIAEVSQPRRTLTADEMRAAEHDANHARVLEINRSLFGLVKSNFRKGVAIQRSGTVSKLAALPAIGDLRNFRINNLVGNCSSYNEITARVVYVGQKAVLYEDVTAPLAGAMNTYYATLGQLFDASMYQSDLTNFADPLATDPYTDADGHMNMVFSKKVNDLGLAGFVITCDFFPRNTTDNTQSNLGEYFYARVPTAAGTGFSSDTPDSWYRGIRTTVVHEVKHIASFGARLLNPNATSFEDSWLEEGTARHAEELWLRNYVYATPWKSNITYAASVYCDVRPTFPECAGRPYGITSHFSMLYTFLDNPAAYSPFGRVAAGDFNFYGSAWSLVRWAIDRYASAEATFLTGLTQASAHGMANVGAQTGATTIDMLGNWSLALYLDENSVFGTNANVMIPTWNTRDIFSSLNRDIPASFPKVFPLTPTAITAGDFSADNNGIRGGSFAMYDVSGPAPAGRALSLTGFGGSGAASPSLRIAIARIQ